MLHWLFYVVVSILPQTIKFKCRYIPVNQAYGSFRKEKTGANKMLKRVKTTWAINEPVLSQDAKEQLPLIECECGAKILFIARH